MPTPYQPEAIEDAFRLYLKYNGQNHTQIQKEMRKTWPGWSKQNLYTRGKRPNQKIGWIEKFGWDKALKLHLAAAPEGVLNSDEQFVVEIDTVRKRLYTAFNAQGAKADRDTGYLYRDFCKLSIEARTKIGSARDTLGAFVLMAEKMLEWLPEMGKNGVAAARAVLKVWDQMIEKATAEYGNQENTPDNGSQS